MFDILKELKNPQMIQELSQKAGVDQADIQKIATLGVPTILEALNLNAQDEQGAQSLAKAFDDHKHDNTNDMTGFLDRFLNQGEGSRMLEHIFPKNNRNVEENISEQTGLGSDKVRRILSIIAPLLIARMASNWVNKRKQAPEPQVQEERPNTLPRYRQEDILDVTREAKEETRRQTNDSLFDMGRKILTGEKSDNDGGILGDILGSIFGK